MVVYYVLAVMPYLMQPYRDIDIGAPFSMPFNTIGMEWNKTIVDFDVLKGMTTMLPVNVVGQVRYLTNITYVHMAPRRLSVVSARWGTPVVPR
jgi:APA family basic amino acid/polyamine antiporter